MSKKHNNSEEVELIFDKEIVDYFQVMFGSKYKEAMMRIIIIYASEGMLAGYRQEQIDKLSKENVSAAAA